MGVHSDDTIADIPLSSDDQEICRVLTESLDTLLERQLNLKDTLKGTEETTIRLSVLIRAGAHITDTINERLLRYMFVYDDYSLLDACMGNPKFNINAPIRKSDNYTLLQIINSLYERVNSGYYWYVACLLIEASADEQQLLQTVPTENRPADDMGTSDVPPHEGASKTSELPDDIPLSSDDQEICRVLTESLDTLLERQLNLKDTLKGTEETTIRLSVLIRAGAHITDTINERLLRYMFVYDDYSLLDACMGNPKFNINAPIRKSDNYTLLQIINSRYKRSNSDHYHDVARILINASADENLIGDRGNEQQLLQTVTTENRSADDVGTSNVPPHEGSTTASVPGPSNGSSFSWGDDDDNYNLSIDEIAFEAYDDALNKARTLLKEKNELDETEAAAAATDILQEVLDSLINLTYTGVGMCDKMTDDIIELIDMGAEISRVNDLLLSYISLFYQYKLIDKLKDKKGFDINSAAFNNLTLLQVAVDRFQDEESLKFIHILIAAGADVNALRCDGKTLLHIAAENQEDITALIEMLVTEHGMDVDSVTPDNETALQIAVKHAAPGTVKALIDVGSNTAVVTDDGNNLLHLAVIHGRDDLVSIFVEAGVDVNAENTDKKTPLQMAIDKNVPLHSNSQKQLAIKTDLIRALIIARADVLTVNQELINFIIIHEQYDLIPQLLAANEGFDINLPGNDGLTLLQTASNNDRFDIVESLLTAGADITSLKSPEDVIKKILEKRINAEVATFTGALSTEFQNTISVLLRYFDPEQLLLQLPTTTSQEKAEIKHMVKSAINNWHAQSSVVSYVPNDGESGAGPSQEPSTEESSEHVTGVKMPMTVN